MAKRLGFALAAVMLLGAVWVLFFGPSRDSAPRSPVSDRVDATAPLVVVTEPIQQLATDLRKNMLMESGLRESLNLIGDRIGVDLWNPPTGIAGTGGLAAVVGPSGATFIRPYEDRKAARDTAIQDLRAGGGLASLVEEKRDGHVLLSQIKTESMMSVVDIFEGYAAYHRQPIAGAGGKPKSSPTAAAPLQPAKRLTDSQHYRDAKTRWPGALLYSFIRKPEVPAKSGQATGSASVGLDWLFQNIQGMDAAILSTPQGLNMQALLSLESRWHAAAEALANADKNARIINPNSIALIQWNIPLAKILNWVGTWVPGGQLFLQLAVFPRINAFFGFDATGFLLQHTDVPISIQFFGLDGKTPLASLTSLPIVWKASHMALAIHLKDAKGTGEFLARLASDPVQHPGLHWTTPMPSPGGGPARVKHLGSGMDLLVQLTDSTLNLCSSHYACQLAAQNAAGPSGENPGEFVLDVELSRLNANLHQFGFSGRELPIRRLRSFGLVLRLAGGSLAVDANLLLEAKK